MTLKSIEKLREFIDNQFVASGQAYLQGMAIAGGIEAEIAERYMPRPCDMDGVPIKIGDELSHDGFARNFIVHSYELVDGTWAVWDMANGATHICSACRHVKPRTVEDVLRDVVTLCANTWKDEKSAFRYYGVDNVMESGNIADFAAELRDLMEVDR